MKNDGRIPGRREHQRRKLRFPSPRYRGINHKPAWLFREPREKTSRTPRLARVRVHRRPNPASTRLPKLRDREPGFPAPPASGPSHFRPRSAHAQLGGAALSGAWKGRSEAAAGPRPPSPERAESALPRGGVCPVLTLAAEPGRSSSRLPAALSCCWTLASRPCAPLAPGAPPTHTHPPSAARTAVVGGCPALRCSQRSGIPGPVTVGGVKRREPSLPAARERRTSESEGFLGQVAPRRWSPSRGSGWPTRSTARISLSAATSPRPREMPPKRKRR